MDTRNRLAANSNDALTDDTDVAPARLSVNSNEDAASDDD
jgi:hypothetical protein